MPTVINQHQRSVIPRDHPCDRALLRQHADDLSDNLDDVSNLASAFIVRGRRPPCRQQACARTERLLAGRCADLAGRARLVSPRTEEIGPREIRRATAVECQAWCQPPRFPGLAPVGHPGPKTSISQVFRSDAYQYRTNHGVLGPRRLWYSEPLELVRFGVE
jgi:hypothetical protein